MRNAGESFDSDRGVGLALTCYATRRKLWAYGSHLYAF
jgi:hypothetical protein